MPARVIDGEGLWRSKKIKALPLAFRAEYANLVSLAEANGVFDCDPDHVWAEVYAFNRPDVTPKAVVQILDSLEHVDLLRRFTAAGRVYGYWTGIHKSGRLPTGTHLARYKNLPPNPPPEILGEESPRSTTPGELPDTPGLVGDVPAWFGIGLNRSGDGVVLSQNQNEEETNMKAKKEIPPLCRRILGTKAEIYDNVWAEVKELETLYGSTIVINTFAEWAATRAGDDLRGKPVTEFLKTADGLLSGTLSAVVSPATGALANELAYLSGGAVTFDDQAKSALTRLLKDHSEAELAAAFRQYFGDLSADDAFQMKYAAKKFTEKAEQLVYVQRRRKADQKQSTEVLEATRSASVLQAEAERQSRSQKRAVEHESVEDTLSAP